MEELLQVVKLTQYYNEAPRTKQSARPEAQVELKDACA